eukprot:1770198-Rhodomonas_salina.2
MSVWGPCGVCLGPCGVCLGAVWTCGAKTSCLSRCRRRTGRGAGAVRDRGRARGGTQHLRGLRGLRDAARQVTRRARPRRRPASAESERSEEEEVLGGGRGGGRGGGGAWRRKRRRKGRERERGRGGRAWTVRPCSAEALSLVSAWRRTRRV